MMIECSFLFGFIVVPSGKFNKNPVETVCAPKDAIVTSIYISMID